MEEDNEVNFENQLTVETDRGEKVKLNVLDIIDSYAFNKSFIIYNFEDEPDSVYASILNEGENTYSLDTITNQEEIDYITSEIERVLAEKDEED